MQRLTTPPLGTLLSGKYQLIAVLGEGGMGKVYLAENVDIGRQVAVKTLRGELSGNPELLGRFRIEARAAAAIGHPGIVDVLDLGTSPEGMLFMVMERLLGESLGARLRRSGPMSLEAATAVVDAVLDALAAAHDKGIVHRDLKPDNVFLVERPQPIVKLLDFGLSKFRGGEDLSLTRAGDAMGTVAYMAPEQARSAKDAGPPADLYAVGGILYEALCGRAPFLGASHNEVLARVLTEPPPPLSAARPDLPGAVLDLLERLLAKSPEGRPAGAPEAREELRAAVGQVRGPEAWLPSIEETALRDSRTAPKLLASPMGWDSGGPLGRDGLLATPRPREPAPADGLEPTFRRSSEAAAPSRRRWWFLGAGAAALAAAAVFGPRMLPSNRVPLERGEDPPAHAPSGGAVAPAPPASRKATVRLVASPETARWVRDGQLVCPDSTCTVEGTAGSKATYSVSAPGHLDAEREVTFDAERELLLGGPPVWSVTLAKHARDAALKAASSRPPAPKPPQPPRAEPSLTIDSTPGFLEPAPPTPGQGGGRQAGPGR